MRPPAVLLRSIPAIVLSFVAITAVLCAAPPQSGSRAAESRAESRPDADLTAEGLTRRLAELRPAIEAALGADLGPPIPVMASTADEIRAALVEEQAVLRAGFDLPEPETAIRAGAKRVARQTSKFLCGKTDLMSGALRICPENIRRIAALAPEFAPLRSQGVVDVLLMHEAVHVWQHRALALAAFTTGSASEEALQCRSAVIEGHADWVAYAAAERLGRTDDLRAYALCSRAVPSTVTDEAERYAAEVFSAGIAFAYTEGRAYFGRLAARLGALEAARRAFTDPPRTTYEVSRAAPDGPRRRDPDVQKIAESAQAILAPAGRVGVRTAPVVRGQLKAVFGPLGEERAEAAVKNVRSAYVAIAAPAASTNPNRYVAASIMDCGTEACALAALDLMKTCMEEKDAKFSDSRASVHIKSAEYSATGLDGAGFFVDKSVEGMGPGGGRVATMTAVRGAFVVEIGVVQISDTKEQIAGEMRAIFAAVDDETAAAATRPESRPAEAAAPAAPARIRGELRARGAPPPKSFRIDLWRSGAAPAVVEGRDGAFDAAVPPGPWLIGRIAYDGKITDKLLGRRLARSGDAPLVVDFDP